MTDTARLDVPVSKVLILDDNPKHSGAIKSFCADTGLIPLKVRKDRLMSVLRTNIDLGGILFSETYGETVEESLDIASMIHSARPELPIIIRRENAATLLDLPPAHQRAFAGAYNAGDIDGLRKLVGESIFSLIYPNVLVRGIVEITEAVLKSQFQPWQVSAETPCVVHDRMIFGEVFSLIPIESSWCRGYMMLQTEEGPLLDLLNRADGRGSDANFRMVNSLLGEVTNLIWGTFKNRYIGDAAAAGHDQVQVPLVVNHQHKYISFGTENPQLCFRYVLADPATSRTLVIMQRFVFNLKWSPENFAEQPADGSATVDSGELELF